MNRYEQLKSLITETESDFLKFYDKGNQAAGTRIRGLMMDIKKLAQEIRKEIVEKKNVEK